jgi:hypothetical protein
MIARPNLDNIEIYSGESFLLSISEITPDEGILNQILVLKTTVGRPFEV